jgi:molybdate transport system substrate-binding protein
VRLGGASAARPGTQRRPAERHAIPGSAAARVAASLALALAAACGGDVGDVGVLRVAVAANFAGAQQELAQRFTESTGFRVETALGSSGQLFAQISNGAPFHVFLSADRERPEALEAAGFAEAGSRFSYAEGRLVLFGPGLDSVRSGGADLRERADVRVSLANPETAPYGAAAVQVLEALGVFASLAPRLAQGESVAQAEQFVRSGAAELGFLSLAQVVGEPDSTYWLIPSELHAPLLQDAVLLQAGASHPAARAYLDFLRGGEARRIIQAHGYALPGSGGP